MYRGTVLVLAWMCCWPIFLSADGPGTEEKQTLEERMRRLESELETFRDMHSRENEIKKKEKEEWLKKNDALQKKIEKLEAELGGVKNGSVQSKFMAKLYGYVKLDMAYDTARTYNGNICLWVESEENIEEDDDQFNMTANQTRLGLDLFAPEYKGIKTSGKIEIDFYGDGAENAPRLRMRRGYIQVDVPSIGFSLLAGQEWEIVGPLNPDTINFLVLCSSGNIGYRRPQLRLTEVISFNEQSKLTLQAALARTIGHGSNVYPAYLDSGEDSGFPTIQGRVALSVPLWFEKPATLGISGHWGQEEYDIEIDGTHERFETWSLVLEINLPITRGLTFKGEIWAGKNLDTYFGGILQGVNTTKRKEISSRGGWASFNIGPFSDFHFNIGGGIDDPQDRDLNAGNREVNYSFFGNVFYDITEFLQVAVEVSYWETRYRHREHGDAVRLHGAMMFKF